MRIQLVGSYLRTYDLLASFTALAKMLSIQTLENCPILLQLIKVCAFAKLNISV